MTHNELASRHGRKKESGARSTNRRAFIIFFGGAPRRDAQACSTTGWPAQRHWLVSSFAISRYRQKAFANCICRGVRHSGSKICEEPTMIDTHLARELATLSRSRL